MSLTLPSYLKIGELTWPLQSVSGPTHAAHADFDAITLHLGDAQCAEEVKALLDEYNGDTLELRVIRSDKVLRLTF